MSYTLEMEAISAIAAASGVFLAGLERDQSTEAAASWPEIKRGQLWDPESGKNLFRIPDPGVKKTLDPIRNTISTIQT